ncbi:hypothetical protein EU527_18095 [Candidatus Thorarchaeota archaeon]|nr:MAG: hypothetical protein EU527_18095 [Candidatus Thorarchaeota archaeon]
MRELRNTIVCSFAISLFLILILGHCTVSTICQSIEPKNTSTISDYDNPIKITSNSDFAFEASLRGWDGDGSEVDPYIIEDYQISSGRAIEISSTTVYFIIRDCELGSPSGYRALYLYNVRNGDIQSVTLDGHDAIYVEYCEDIHIHDNDCYGDAIITESSSINLTSNFIGLRLEYWNSESCAIVSNELSLFWLMYSDNFIIEDNDISYDFFIYGGHHSVEGNTLEKEALGYFQDLVSETIDVTKYGIIILQSCQDIVIEKGYFEGTSICVEIYESTDCRIENNEFIDCSEPIKIWSSSDCEVANNIVRDADIGVYFEESTGCKIDENKLIYCGKGIQIEESYDGYIVDNYIVSSLKGIKSDTCQEFDIVGNYICGSSHTSIDLFNSTGFLIFDNQFGWNGPPNAIDEEGVNSWDNGEGVGNSWSSYDGEGIFTIYGSSGSVDHFPAELVDNELPIMVSLNHTPASPFPREIITVIANATDNHGISKILIEISEDNNETWTQYEMIREGNQWVYSAKALGPSFNYRIIVKDWAYNQIESEIVCIVLYRTSTSTTSTSQNTTTNTQNHELQMTLGLTLIILIVVGVVIKFRK